MTWELWLIASLWLALALVAAFIATWLRLSTAVCEIIVGAVAPPILYAVFGIKLIDPSESWVSFLAGAAALLLTFLAGSELEPGMLRTTWKQALTVGFAGFAAPFAGVALVTRYLLGWTLPASAVAAVALSAASVSVVYTFLLEMGINDTRFGKSILAASYVNNLMTVVALGAIFAPFTRRTLIFIALMAASFVVLPFLTSKFFGRLRGRVAEPDVRYLLLLLFALGGLAAWAGGEPVLPAYVLGMVLAGLVGKNASLISHLRILTFGLLTPFYFLRAGAQMSITALWASPLLFCVLLTAKLGSKLAGVMPVLRLFNHRGRDAVYYSLMISTGLGLAIISATFGFQRALINQTQYSHLVAAVVGSAVLPTVIASRYLVPRQLLVKAAGAMPRLKRSQRPAQAAGR
jgi:glutathione-regulated potassium-efflux system ancillary protein KefC